MAKKQKVLVQIIMLKVNEEKDLVVMQNIIKVRRGVDEAKVFLYKEV
jgi:hypothetical protein